MYLWIAQTQDAELVTLDDNNEEAPPVPILDFFMPSTVEVRRLLREHDALKTEHLHLLQVLKEKGVLSQDEAVEMRRRVRDGARD